jgi:ornithine decarboxylase/lysine decarboxylase/arginine decarboxylase
VRAIRARALRVQAERMVDDCKALGLGDHLQGRITTSLITPYPPGIPLLIPGEVFNRKIVDYLKFAREFARLLPGFETDIHGLVEEKDDGGQVRFYADCVAATA